MVFERKVLRKIFGPTKERDGTWRIKTNDELVKHKNIIKHMKAQRLSWFGHLHRMPEERIVTKYTSGNRCQYDHKADQRTDGKMGRQNVLRNIWYPSRRLHSFVTMNH